MKRNPEDVFFRRNRCFQEKISEKDILDSDVVIGFDTSSWILADTCKKLGVPFILDVSIAHPIEKEKIFLDIAKKFPEWQDQLQTKKPEYIQLEQKECELADIIVVPGNFVKRTLY